MSTAIPFHYLMSSYPDEKLIKLEEEYFQKLEDFSKVFCDKLQDGSITDFDYPFYREFLHTCNYNHSFIRDIMHDRKLPIPKRERAKCIISVHDVAIEKGFNWRDY